MLNKSESQKNQGFRHTTLPKKCAKAEIFNRLSPIEQKILLTISQRISKLDCLDCFVPRNDIPPNDISREDLRKNLDLSPVDFSNGLLSLQQRYLVKTRVENKQILFYLTPVFQAYLQNFSYTSP